MRRTFPHINALIKITNNIDKNKLFFQLGWKFPIPKLINHQSRSLSWPQIFHFNPDRIPDPKVFESLIRIIIDKPYLDAFSNSESPCVLGFWKCNITYAKKDAMKIISNHDIKIRIPNPKHFWLAGVQFMFGFFLWRGLKIQDLILRQFLVI